jgi:cytochrome c-type biogenesis protein CcmH/NrfG
MNQEEKHQLQIEAYLNQELTDSEMQDFEREMDQDPKLKAQFEEFESAYQFLHVYRRSQLKRELNKIAEATPDYQVKPIYKKTWFVAAASFFVLCSSVYLYAWQNHSDQGIIDQTFAPYASGTFGLRGSQLSNQASTFQKGIQQYSQGQYDSTIHFLTQIPTEDIHYLEGQFYLGNTYLATENPKDAIMAFESANGLEAMESARKWYLSLAYLADSQTEKAHVLLAELAQTSPDPHYQKKAQELQEKLGHPLRKLLLIEK